jgi:hypothetical protein
MLAHASAAMTLDVYADLFDDDFGHIAEVLNDARLASSVGKMWAPAADDSAQAQKNPVITRMTGFVPGGTGGI